jgi:hypothetical protein
MKVSQSPMAGPQDCPFAGMSGDLCGRFESDNPQTALAAGGALTEDSLALKIGASGQGRRPEAHDAA